MLRVHICEDEKEQREHIRMLIKDIIEWEQLDMKLGVVTEQPDELIEQVKKEKTNGIFFLDVDLQNQINGLELAKLIREYQPRCYIIFVTTHSEMSYMTFMYKVEAMDYIIKDNFQDLKNRIYQCLVHAQELEIQNESHGLPSKFSVKVGSKKMEISYDDILFFEANTGSHKIILHTKNSVIEFNGKLKEVETKLNDVFYRCHRGYIVNTKMIVEVDEKENLVRLLGGEECPISVRLGKALKK